MFVNLFGVQAILECSWLPGNGIRGVVELRQLLPVERDGPITFGLVALNGKLVLLHERGKLVSGGRSLHILVTPIWVEEDAFFTAGGAIHASLTPAIVTVEDAQKL